MQTCSPCFGSLVLSPFGVAGLRNRHPSMALADARSLAVSLSPGEAVKEYIAGQLTW